MQSPLMTFNFNQWPKPNLRCVFRSDLNHCLYNWSNCGHAKVAFFLLPGYKNHVVLRLEYILDARNPNSLSCLLVVLVVWIVVVMTVVIMHQLSNSFELTLLLLPMTDDWSHGGRNDSKESWSSRHLGESNLGLSQESPTCQPQDHTSPLWGG